MSILVVGIGFPTMKCEFALCSCLAVPSVELPASTPLSMAIPQLDMTAAVEAMVIVVFVGAL